MSCIHKWRTPEGGKGKERDWEKRSFAVQYVLVLLESHAASLSTSCLLLYLSFSCHCPRASVSLSLSLSVSLSHTCISVSTCLLLISSFITFLFICLRLLLLLLHSSNWEFEIECYMLLGRLPNVLCYFHRPLTVAIYYLCYTPKPSSRVCCLKSKGEVGTLRLLLPLLIL